MRVIRAIEILTGAKTENIETFLTLGTKIMEIPLIKSVLKSKWSNHLFELFE